MPTTLGGVVLPRVYVQDVSREWVGKPIRRWSLRTRVMRRVDYEAIIAMFEQAGGIAQIERAVDGTAHSIGGGAVTLWLDEDAEPTASVYITAFRDSRMPFAPDDGTWDKSGRELELELEES